MMVLVSLRTINMETSVMMTWVLTKSKMSIPVRLIMGGRFYPPHSTQGIMGTMSLTRDFGTNIYDRIQDIIWKNSSV